MTTMTNEVCSRGGKEEKRTRTELILKQDFENPNMNGCESPS